MSRVFKTPLTFSLMYWQPSTATHEWSMHQWTAVHAVYYARTQPCNALTIWRINHCVNTAGSLFKVSNKSILKIFSMTWLNSSGFEKLNKWIKNRLIADRDRVTWTRKQIEVRWILRFVKSARAWSQFAKLVRKTPSQIINYAAIHNLWGCTHA